jgi:hypothetical protein
MGNFKDKRGRFKEKPILRKIIFIKKGFFLGRKFIRKIRFFTGKGIFRKISSLIGRGFFREKGFYARGSFLGKEEFRA